MKKIALLSVSNKTGIVEFAKKIHDLGYDILATGNTAKVIEDSGITCIGVKDFASFPEIFSGRVKTLQPKIFGGILMRRENGSDEAEAIENGVLPIDIVCVNLYPFPEVVNRKDIELDEKIENILASGAATVTGCDVSCLMNIKGRLSRRGENVKVVHIAEILSAKGGEI